MKICHELTPQLFSDFDGENDYDFILPRFWNNSKEYKEHYQKSTKFKILDCGLFEGDEFTTPEFRDLINDVVPDIFIVPDVWNNSTLTLRNAKYWMNIVKKELPDKTKGGLMVVLQGNNIGDFENLYQGCIDLGYTHFAFNFSSRAYSFMGNHPNNLVNQMLGRINIISHLKAAQYIQNTHYIHLLGASLPQEFIYYPKEWEFIKSVDTSSPIINGALGIRYNNWGLLDKPTQKMEEFFDKDLSSKISIINYNIYIFRQFVKQK